MRNISAPTCCFKIGNLRECLKQGMYTDTDYRSISPGERKYILSNQSILDHIRHCSGHGDFLDEMFRGHYTGNFLEKDHNMFLLCLAVVLDADIRGTDLYDRLWNSIPLLNEVKELYVQTVNIPPDVGSLRAKTHISIGTANSTPTPRMFIDFVSCMNELRWVFWVLLSTRTSQVVDIRVSDIRKAIDSGVEVPEDVATLCNSIDKLVPDYKKLAVTDDRDSADAEYLDLFIRTSLHEFCYNKDACLRPSSPFNMALVLTTKYADIPTDKINWMDIEVSIPYNPESSLVDPSGCRGMLEKYFVGRVDISEFEHLLEALSRFTFPIFWEGYKIYLECASRNKSALK